MTGPRIPTLRELLVLFAAVLLVLGWLVLTAASLGRATDRWTPATAPDSQPVVAHLEEP